MTDQPNQELPPAKRRRLIFRAVLRGLLVTTVLVVLYYLLPLDQPWDTGTAVRLVIGLLVFVGVTVWQVRAIAGSRYPGLRAAEALGLIIPFYLLLFASTYFVMERASAANFTQPLTRTDALYFSVTVFTTVGFGDISAKSETARVVLIFQMRAYFGAVRRGQQRRSDTGGDAGPPPSDTLSVHPAPPQHSPWRANGSLAMAAALRLPGTACCRAGPRPLSLAAKLNDAGQDDPRAPRRRRDSTCLPAWPAT